MTKTSLTLSTVKTTDDTVVASATTAVKATENTAAPLRSSVTVWPLETFKTSIAYSSSMQTVSPMTSVLVSSVKAKENTTASLRSNVTVWSLETSKTSIAYSSSIQTVSPMASVPVTSSTGKLTKASDVFSSSNVTIGVPSATSSRVWISTSLEGNVSQNATKPGSQTIIVPDTISIELTTNTHNTVYVASTKTTLSSPSGRLSTDQMQSITANYSLSSASRRGSNSAEPKQTLTTSLPGIDR